MLKVLLFAAFTWGATVQGCRSNCLRNVPPELLICATDSRAITCHRLSTCQLNLENCNRRMLRQPLLRGTQPERCQNIRRPRTSGPCSVIRRSVPRPNCRRLICADTNPVRSCYRNKVNECVSLTVCELQRLNCGRGTANFGARVGAHHCVGLRPMQIARCRNGNQRFN